VHPNLFDVYHPLTLAGQPFLLSPLIEKLAIVQQAADRRLGCRRNLDQVNITFLGHAQRFPDGENPQLLARFINQSNFTSSDSLINAVFFTTYLVSTSYQIIAGSSVTRLAHFARKTPYTSGNFITFIVASQVLRLKA
jgi:hypothetical protein